MSFTDFFTKTVLFKSFLPKAQASFVLGAIERSEHEYFEEKMRELDEVIQSMPDVYAQDGLGDDAIIHLHYFTGGCDWYVTAKDVVNPDDGQLVVATEQHQAFGFVNFNDPQNAEFGYIPISALREHPLIELDFHWEPKTVAEIKKSINSPSLST
ncbi:hypothetical protein [Thiomicrorhabdus indica]|uniref:hypothetical protein n=1 Tax=Thiomicrorhabdus indica TaxID=2267253 RepID=UPI00102DC4BA|nr:hypothetical protein [Thiomicrorhabdus indica]